MTFTSEELKAYYQALPEVYGWDALCKMQLPKELFSKTVLDVACRRGKGVYKLSEQVGAHGKALGVDWRIEMLEKAREGEDRAVQKCGYEQSNMAFIQAYPEQLAQEVEEGSVHFAYVNCVVNVFYNPVEALRQIRTALAPGGLLVCDTVLASGPRNAAVVAEARKLGNAVQAAPFRKDFMGWLASAGFDITSIGTEVSETVDPTWNADSEPTVPVVETDEKVSFVGTSVRIYKPDNIDRHSLKLVEDISKFR